MIDLLARDDRTAFGIASVLAVEGIPYRHVRQLDDRRGRVLVVAGPEVTPEVLELATRVPTVIVGAPASPPRDLFNVSSGRLAHSAAAISLQDAIWPDAVRTAAQRFGKQTLRMPWAPTFCPDVMPAGSVLAAVRRPGGVFQAAIVRNGCCLWSLVDVGAAIAHLLDESYLPAPRTPAPRPLPHSALQLYYRVPEPLRRNFQRRVYRRLQDGLAQQPTPSDYPVDATGWLLVQLLTQLVRAAAGGLVRVARWPAPRTAAAVLTHDLEPTRFAYTQGLEGLATEIARGGHPPTFGVVAGPAARHLTRQGVDRLRGYDILCHGLEHRGETLTGSPSEIAQGIGTARIHLERQFERPVAGFRSPRLDRSPDLLWALDRTGFRYDSSYPDVDRENMTHFGAGVRINVPYRPPIEDGTGGVRPSGCLELPVSAPDCIQPLFEGDDVSALRRAVGDKIAFIRATGGVYVGIVHAGVFGARDAARRLRHLAFVRETLRQPDVWLATASEIAQWWCARERLVVSVEHGRVRVRNEGEATIEGVRLVLEAGAEEVVHDVPHLDPGQDATIVLAGLARWAWAS